MSLDGITLRSLVSELQSTLINGKINKVYQPETDELLMDIRNNGITKKLIVSASSNNPRIHFTDDTKKNPQSPPMFCMLLRKHIQGGRILSIEQYGFERVIKILISSYDELGDLTEKELIVEIMGRHSNIILLDKNNNKIIDSIKRVTPDISSVRQVLPGLKYISVPSQNKISPFDLEKNNFLLLIKDINSSKVLYKSLYENFIGISPLIAKEICKRAGIYENLNLKELKENDIEKIYSSFKSIIDYILDGKSCPTIVYNEFKTKILGFSSWDLIQFDNSIKQHFNTVNEMLDQLYKTKDKLDRIKQKSLSLKKRIKTRLDRDKNKLSKQKDELLNAKNREKYKIAGELITANIYRIEKGMDKIEVLDYYNDNQKITIKLNPNLTPSENAQKKFKRYNKLKNAFIEVSNQIKQTESEINYLENILLSIENASDLDDLEEIREELIEENYIKNRKKYKNKKKSKFKSKPMHFLSSDGYDIYVGKNNKQNDYLTLKFSDKNDFWLHTKDIPGSHVIVRKKGKEIPENTIYEASLLAAYNSKAKMSSNVPVDYTERKNVKKPNGAKPGMVIYENNNTIYVTPTEKEISKINKIN
ncbi:Rqc2 family fibronectin-binding protein [Senegalia massiliensis]|uniref:Rqc2 homolog RqcH n=1 Tax=Senegalia massiliensis TaxID=1720316 RepID=A0A845QY22_9CLOT|nr:NFACT RNA binding domain-containing protein [Senegalia massiliensis]NBI06894.1 fibronectin/fibrinogen-binding protein [Senegalia massiliensis]